MQIIDDMLKSRLQDGRSQAGVLAALRARKGADFYQSFHTLIREDLRSHADAVRTHAEALANAGADPALLSDCIGAAIELGVHDAIQSLISAAIALDGPQKPSGPVS